MTWKKWQFNSVRAHSSLELAPSVVCISRMLTANLNMHFEAIYQSVCASSEHLPKKEGFAHQNKIPSRLGRFSTFNYNTL